MVGGSPSVNRWFPSAIRTAGLLHGGLSVSTLLLLTVGLLLELAGCAVVTPAIPRVLPGYGRDYRIVSMNAHGDISGLLVLRSDYARSPRRIAVFEIAKGRAVIPAEKDVRFSYTTLMDTPLYWGRFENASSTYVFPLVPGYVCQEPYSYAAKGVLSAPGWKEGSGDAAIVLVPAVPEEEAAMLGAVSAEMIEAPQDQGMSDLASRQRVLEYLRSRLQQLQPRRESGTPSPRTDSAR